MQILHNFFYQQAMAWQMLKRRPAMVVGIVFTLGLTLAALLTVFALSWTIVVKPLPYPQQERLVVAEATLFNAKKQIAGEYFNYMDAVDLYKKQTLFERVALIFGLADVLTDHPEQPRIHSSYVTPDYFQVLGVPMQLGRGFGNDEGMDKFQRSVVISFDTWQKWFNGRADILSQSLEVRGQRYQIVGVTQQGFSEPELVQTGRQAGIWLPWDFNWAQQMGWDNQVEDSLRVIALTKSNEIAQTEQQLNNHINAHWQQHRGALPNYKDWYFDIKVRPLAEVLRGNISSLLLYAGLGTIGLLLIAITNIGNLFLSSFAEQQKNLAIQAAVGAKRSQILAQVFAQGVQLSFSASVLALLLSSLVLPLITTSLADILPRSQELSVEWSSAAFALAVSIVLALLLAFLVGRFLNSKLLIESLKTGGKGTGIQVSAGFRKGLVIVQVAIAAALIFLNFSLLQQSNRAIEQPMGIEIDNVQHLKLAINSPTDVSPAQVKAMLEEVAVALRNKPQVETVSKSLAPLIWIGSFPVIITSSNEQLVPQVKFVDGNYFEVLKQPFVQGESFTDEQIRAGEISVVVNQPFADILQQDGEVLGRELIIFGDSYRVKGVVESMYLPLQTNSQPRVFMTDHGRRTNLMVRLKPGQSMSKREVVTAIKSVSGMLSVATYRPIPEIKDQLLQHTYTIALVTAGLTILTILLSALGLHGIISYGIQLRQFELATRMALGAKSKHIITLILSESGKSIGFGLAVAVVFVAIGHWGLNSSNSYAATPSDYLYSFVVAMVAILVLSIWANLRPLLRMVRQPVQRNLKPSE